MAKKKPVINVRSYGIHSKWDAKSKDLPKVKENIDCSPDSRNREVELHSEEDVYVYGARASSPRS